MKRIYTILLIASTLFFFACQQEEKLGEAATGYLRLSINEDISTNSRGDVPADYDPEKIGVQILNAQGGVQETLEPWEIGTKKSIELPVGTYTIKASSAGWDGKAAGLDCPYYTGSKQVTITANAELNETITCTLANVKVTAMVYPELAEKVKSVTIKVYDESNANFQILTKETEASAYFPVVDALYADITIVNQADEEHTLEKQQLGDREGKVNARDHYILNIKPQDSGSSQISVTVDPTTHEYSYTFGMSTKPSESATFTAGAWDRLAYLQATDIVAGTGVSMEGIKFQYREKAEETDQTDEETAQTDEEDEASWTDVATTQEEENKYTAMLTGLKASTEYEYRLVNGEKVAIGKVQSFTTGKADAQTALQNGGFEDWCVRSAGTALSDKNTTFPCSEKDYDTGLFWDTSNRGANSAGQLDPTNKTEDPVISGTYAARLESKLIDAVIIKAFAAASLYTGSFGDASLDMSATINFGRPFTSRPIALHGYYQYNPKNVDNVSENLPANATVSEGKPDQCAIYIALSKKTYTVNNKQESTFIDFEGDDNIIAYGTIEGDYVTESEAKNGYTEFTIPLQYKESQFGETPSYIIIVCSASKYGDYFTGGTGSTLYVDDFSLIYEGTPTIWKNK